MKKTLIMLAIVRLAIGLDSTAVHAQESTFQRRSEVTMRYTAGFISEGPTVTAGIRLSENWTVGVAASHFNTYVDAAPADIHAVSGGAFARGYAHLGRRDIVALYSDVILAVERITSVKGNEYYTTTDPFTGTVERHEAVSSHPGDWGVYAAWQPGIRVRCYRNLHLFLGPTLSTNCIGLHLGLGF